MLGLAILFDCVAGFAFGSIGGNQQCIVHHHRFFPEFSDGSTSIQVFLRYRCDVRMELGDGGSRFNDPPPT